MNLSKYKRWRALLHRVIAKQQSKREQTHPVCLLEVEKCEKVESVNTQNEHETTSKKQTDKKKTDLFFVFCKCVYISRKQVEDRSKEFLGNKNINKKRFIGKGTGHNDHHYMINMGGQRPKIGGN